MRLIDADAAAEVFGLSEKTRKYGGDHSGYNTMMLYEIQDVLDNLPTIEQPQTGHWIVTDEAGHAKCSKCGASMDLGGGDYHNYCSNCGARMAKHEKTDNSCPDSRIG